MHKNATMNFNSIFMKEQKTGRFFSHILLPLWILTFYFLIISSFLPKGVNKIFAAQCGKYSLWISIVLSLVFLIIILTKKGTISLLKKTKKKFLFNNAVLLLLPLTAVMQYIINNFHFLSLWEAIYTFLLFTIFIAIFILIIPFLLKRICSTQILMYLGVALMFTLINMGSLSRQFAWHEKGNLMIQLAIFIVVFFICCVFLFIKQQKILHILIVAMFLSTSAMQYLQVRKASQYNGTPESENKLLTLVDSRKPKITPDIYLIIYDAYVTNETMLSYGIDNSTQEKYLQDNGFQLYPNNYSIGSSSQASMSRVLNASDELYGVSQKGCSGAGTALKMLQNFGYKTYGIFQYDFCFRGYRSSYDYSVPAYASSPAFDLIKGISIGEFEFNIGFDKVPQETFEEERATAFSEKVGFPKFVYTHTLIPGHSQNSGKCLADAGDIKIYETKLQQANIKMKKDVENILKNDPDAIIIIAGDHGPYLTKNCIGLGPSWTSAVAEVPYDISEVNRQDIQDRFGAFLAIRWPTQDYKTYDHITVSQDLFTAIFAYMFQDISLLEAKVNPITVGNDVISGASVVDGVIKGGINDGQPLFIVGTE